MKKISYVLLAVILIVTAFTGCSNVKNNASDSNNTTAAAKAQNTAQGAMPTVLNTAEYTLYQNIFFNGQKADFDGKEAQKEGTFATLTDAYNNVTRYYVWGYNDNTKCCDWQWELKIDDTSSLPENGSLVTVKGVYAVDEAALDGFWIVSPEITVKTAFAGRDCDIDMQSMSNTLERVQVSNLTQKKEAFEGKTVCAYGRMKNETCIEDPYYDNSWELGIETSDTVLAFGTMTEITGTLKNGTVTDCKLKESTQY